MTMHARIESDWENDPVIVDVYASDDAENPIHLRIGEAKAGATRYVLLTRRQALTVARTLQAAAEAVA